MAIGKLTKGSELKLTYKGEDISSETRKEIVYKWFGLSADIASKQSKVLAGIVSSGFFLFLGLNGNHLLLVPLFLTAPYALKAQFDYAWARNNKETWEEKYM